MQHINEIYADHGLDGLSQLNPEDQKIFREKFLTSFGGGTPIEDEYFLSLLGNDLPSNAGFAIKRMAYDTYLELSSSGYKNQVAHDIAISCATLEYYALMHKRDFNEIVKISKIGEWLKPYL